MALCFPMSLMYPWRIIKLGNGCCGPNSDKVAAVLRQGLKYKFTARWLKAILSQLSHSAANALLSWSEIFASGVYHHFTFNP